MARLKKLTGTFWFTIIVLVLFAIVGWVIVLRDTGGIR